MIINMKSIKNIHNPYKLKRDYIIQNDSNLYNKISFLNCVLIAWKHSINNGANSGLSNQNSTIYNAK